MQKTNINHITILLATYNGEKYLSSLLNSLLNQTYLSWNILIHDDNSTDRTVEIIHRYVEKHPKKIKFLADEVSFGSASSNFGFLVEQSDADYIMFCDQDDVWLPNKIERTLDEMKKLEARYSSSPLMVFSDLKIVNENLTVIAESMWRSQKLNPDIINDLNNILALNVVTGCTVMINDRAKQIISPIPQKDILHDHWIAVNMAKYGYTSYIDEPLILYRQHSTNVMGAKSRGFQYFLNKSKSLFKDWKTFQAKYSYFDFPINLRKVVWQKIVLNSKRLF